MARNKQVIVKFSSAELEQARKKAQELSLPVSTALRQVFLMAKLNIEYDS